MPEIKTLADANKALQPYVPLVKQLTGADTVLDRIRPLMDLLGNPQDKTRNIHIAGTSGKTSTAYYIAALLSAAGKRVGLTVSPHVDSVTERVQINGTPLDDNTFCSYLGEFLGIVEKVPAKPSYFELLYAFSFWVFEREGVDYAVIETGLGGLHDATNIASRPDKLCIITDIGFDHMHILGNTLREIAAQKIGIVHKHNPVIMYAQTEEVSAVVENWVREHEAQLIVTSEDTENQKYGSDFVAGIPEYQQRNWLLAHAVYTFLQSRDGLPSLSIAQLQATQALQVPGRMDRRTIGNKVIVMDGAHNGQKMEAFTTSFQHAYPGVRPAVMIALKEGKEPADVAPLLTSFASELIITTFSTSQDLQVESINPEELARIFRKAGATNIVVESNLERAYKMLLKSNGDIGVITGSFYLLSQLRNSEYFT